MAKPVLFYSSINTGVQKGRNICVCDADIFFADTRLCFVFTIQECFLNIIKLVLSVKHTFIIIF